MTKDDGLLTPAQAAEYLGIPRSRLKRHTAAREIPFHAFGEHTKRYDRVDLDKFIADRRVPAKPVAARRAPSRRRAGE